MSIYAIGVVRDTTSEIKVRLISVDRGKSMDVNLRDLAYYINKEEGVRNLGYDKKGELKWTQGVVERYPMIDMITGIIKNENSVIILGLADMGIQKYYRICNLNGQITTVKEAELIEYGKSYKLANCKVVSKSNKEFISAIEGEIEQIDTKPKYRMLVDQGYLEINIPFIASNELNIPSVIEGIPISDVYSIVVKPEISAKSITKLTLSNQFKAIRLGLFTSFTNLEELTLLGKNIDIYDDAFTVLKNIKRINIESIRATGIGICSGLTKLEEFNCKTPIQDVQSNAFYNCVSLNIGTVLKEGTKYIGTKAFYNNLNNNKLTIPSTITTVLDNSFERCKNLKEVDIQTDLLQIQTNSRNNSSGLFNGLKDIMVYKSRVCIIDRGFISDDAKVFIKEATARDISIEKKVTKSNIVGLSLDINKVVTNVDEIRDLLIAIPQKDIADMMVNCVNNMLRLNVNYSFVETISLGGFKFKISLGRCAGLNSAKKIRNIGKFLVLTGKNLIFYPLDRDLIRNSIGSGQIYRGGAMIEPAVASSKGIKSIDIGEDGSIRIIYERDGQIETKYIDRFVDKREI